MGHIFVRPNRAVYRPETLQEYAAWMTHWKATCRRLRLDARTLLADERQPPASRQLGLWAPPGEAIGG